MIMLNYELAKRLKEAGFPWKKKFFIEGEVCDCVFMAGEEKVHSLINKCGYRPTLEELIEACGEKFKRLERVDGGQWFAYTFDLNHEHLDSFQGNNFQIGNTPGEAVANLWLELNKKS